MVGPGRRGGGANQGITTHESFASNCQNKGFFQGRHAFLAKMSQWHFVTQTWCKSAAVPRQGGHFPPHILWSLSSGREGRGPGGGGGPGSRVRDWRTRRWPNQGVGSGRRPPGDRCDDGSMGDSHTLNLDCGRLSRRTDARVHTASPKESEPPCSTW